MVEVFQTNVNETYQANMLLNEINKHFKEYEVNFDLEDCDRILRIESRTEPIQTEQIMNLIKELGFNVEVLSDEIKIV
ncbi:MAG: hypothetical protein ABIP51_19230 [Bacteroidia bacterium]